MTVFASTRPATRARPGMLGERAQADGPAPVLADEDQLVVEAERVEERAEPARVVLERVQRRIARLVREAEADEVGQDDAHRLAGERDRDLAPEVAPRRVAVEHDAPGGPRPAPSRACAGRRRRRRASGGTAAGGRASRAVRAVHGYQPPGGPRSLSSLGGGCTGLGSGASRSSWGRRAGHASFGGGAHAGCGLAALARKAATTAADLIERRRLMSSMRCAADGLVVAMRARSSAVASGATVRACRASGGPSPASGAGATVRWRRQRSAAECAPLPASGGWRGRRRRFAAEALGAPRRALSCAGPVGRGGEGRAGGRRRRAAAKAPSAARFYRRGGRPAAASGGGIGVTGARGGGGGERKMPSARSASRIACWRMWSSPSSMGAGLSSPRGSLAAAGADVVAAAAGGCSDSRRTLNGAAATGSRVRSASASTTSGAGPSRSPARAARASARRGGRFADDEHVAVTIGFAPRAGEQQRRIGAIEQQLAVDDEDAARGVARQPRASSCASRRGQPSSVSSVAAAPPSSALR